MDTDKIKLFGARVEVDGTRKLAELERAERVSFLPSLSSHRPFSNPLFQEKMKSKVEAIVAHGINCFVNRQLIYNYPDSLYPKKASWSSNTLISKAPRGCR